MSPEEFGIALEDYIKRKYYEAEANKAFAAFINAVGTKNNRSIENTIVIKVIDRILSDGKVELLKKGTLLYRGRIVGLEDLSDQNKGFEVIEGRKIISGYNEWESKEPPLTVSKHGRNNIAGVSYLYLAENIYTACCEVRPQVGDLISVATFQVDSDLQIVDLAHVLRDVSLKEFEEKNKIDVPALLTLIALQFSANVKEEADYLPSQIISDYIRKFGCDGLSYISSRGDAINYTIFNSHERNIKFISSENYFADKMTCPFYCINNADKIESKNPHKEPDIKKVKKELLQLLSKRKN